jgi:hypothetical protein
MTITRPDIITAWHYRCPECGITDAETGHHADAYMLHCEVCREEGRHVRLKRWPVEQSGAAQGSRAA